MSLQTSFINHLGQQSSITELVPAARIFWTTVPEGTELPSIVVQKILDSADHHQLGAGSLAEARLQVTCMSDDPSEAAAIADAVRLKCDGLQQTTIGREGDTVDVISVRLENGSDGFDPPQAGSDVGTPDVNMDFLVWYRTTVPSFS